jgi:small-conductance mechanosensitive channel
LAELRIFGLILVLSFFGTFFIHIYKDDSKDENNPISEHRNLVLALILAVIIIALFDHWLFSLPFGIMLSGSILGIMAASRKPSLLTE